MNEINKKEGLDTFYFNTKISFSSKLSNRMSTIRIYKILYTNCNLLYSLYFQII